MNIFELETIYKCALKKGIKTLKELEIYAKRKGANTLPKLLKELQKEVC